MKLHIMLIDDDKEELSFFLDALNKIPIDDGFKCTYAGNTAQALIMLRYLIPDFIFVDLNMPNLDGLGFLANTRLQDNLNKVKIYLYSNSITEPVRKKAMILGATGCINKVNTIDELATQLQSVFVELNSKA